MSSKNNIIYSPANERCCKKNTYIPIERCQDFSLSSAISLALITVNLLSSNLMGFPTVFTVFNDATSTTDIVVSSAGVGTVGSSISPGSSFTGTQYEFSGLNVANPTGGLVTGKVCFTLYYRIKI